MSAVTGPVAASVATLATGPLGGGGAVPLSLVLHGGAPSGGSYVPVLALGVVAVWGLVAALVVGVDRLLGRLGVA